MRDQRFIAIQRGGSLTLEHHRLLIDWARKCVLHVLPLLEDAVDERLTHALETAEAWPQGNVPVGAAMQAAYRCHAAARDAVTLPATLVARAVGQMVATAHMADHSLGAAWYSLKAVMAAGGSVEDEREWQNEQLPLEIRELVLSELQDQRFAKV